MTFASPGALRWRARADGLLDLHESGDLEATLVEAEALLSDLDGEELDDPVVRETVFVARFERAVVLAELGRFEEAADAYGLAAATPADEGDPDQRHELAMALLHRGICFDAVGDLAAAIDTYEQLDVRFGGADDLLTRDQVVRGRVNRAAGLLGLGRVDEALEAADALVGTVDPDEPLQAEQLAMAVRVRAAALRAVDRVAEAADSLEAVEVVPDDDPAARAQVALAQRDRADALVELDRARDAAALLDATVARFSGDPDPTVVMAVDELVVVAAELHRELDGGGIASSPPEHT